MPHQSYCYIFAPDQIKTASRIVDLIQRDFPLVGSCRIWTKLEDLRSEMKPIASNSGITILLASKIRDLNQILTMSNWFEDMPVILAVPDNRPETIAKAHLLRPRYLIVKKINWTELKTVVRHIFAIVVIGN